MASTVAEVTRAVGKTILYELRVGFWMVRFVPLMRLISRKVNLINLSWKLETGVLFGGTAYENIL